MVSYTNTDAAMTAKGVVISKQIPPGTSFVTVSSDPAWKCPNKNAGTVCVANIGDIAPHKSGSLKFTVLLSKNEQDVPEVIGTFANLSQATPANTPLYTLAAGEANMTVDAGIVLIESSLQTAGPTVPTSLPTHDQPKQKVQLFLPSLESNAGPVQSSSVQEPAAQPAADEAQASGPKAEKPQKITALFLPAIGSGE
jgi:hypothetical protein